MIENYLVAKGMETLHPRIRTHDDRLFRPQELDVLPNSSEVE
jgi:hypothetical protein